MAKEKTTKRKTKQTTCPCVLCWRVLRHVDRFSGAAGAAAADGGDGGAGSSSASSGGRAILSDTDEGENGPLASSAFQSRPRGSKAARKEMTEHIRASRMLKDSSDALLALARATTERTAVAFFNNAKMRDTPEAIVFLKMHARMLMVGALMDVCSTPPAILSGMAAVLVTEAGSSTAPAAVSEVHPPPPVGNRPVAVESKVQSPPASADNTPAVPATTAPVPKKTGRGKPSHGARSQVTKQAKAAAEFAAASTTSKEDDKVYWVPMHHNKAADDSDCAFEESREDNDHYESLQCSRWMCFVLQRAKGFLSPSGRVFPGSVHHASYQECATHVVDSLHFWPLNIYSRKHRRRALQPPQSSAHGRRNQHTSTPGPIRAPNTRRRSLQYQRRATHI